MARAVGGGERASERGSARVWERRWGRGATWFDISVHMFKFIRGVFVSKNLRMPAVTIFRSCMLEDSAETKYIYSIASTVWINNFVFDKAPYFSAKDCHRNTNKDVARAPLSHLKSNDDNRYSLSANAAFFLARHFHGTTCLVHFCDILSL